MHGWIDAWMNWWVDGWIVGWMSREMNEWTDKETERWGWFGKLHDCLKIPTGRRIWI